MSQWDFEDLMDLLNDQGGLGSLFLNWKDVACLLSCLGGL